VEQELPTIPEHMSSPPIISGVRVTRSLVLYVCFVDRCLSFCTFSFGHCIVSSSTIYGFWLPLWYLQNLLILYKVDKMTKIKYTQCIYVVSTVIGSIPLRRYIYTWNLIFLNNVIRNSLKRRSIFLMPYPIFGSVVTSSWFTCSQNLKTGYAYISNISFIFFLKILTSIVNHVYKKMCDALRWKLYPNIQMTLMMSV
jgi:hypothetical protein